MYIRIYWGKIAPGTWPLLEEKYRDLMKVHTDGLLARFVTQDENDPESMFTITVWRDAESVQAWESSSEYRDVFLASVRPYIVGSQSVSLCKVKVMGADGLLAALAEA